MTCSRYCIVFVYTLTVYIRITLINCKVRVSKLQHACRRGSLKVRRSLSCRTFMRARTAQSDVIRSALFIKRLQQTKIILLRVLYVCTDLSLPEFFSGKVISIYCLSPAIVVSVLSDLHACPLGWGTCGSWWLHWP